MIRMSIPSYDILKIAFPYKYDLFLTILFLIIVIDRFETEGDYLKLYTRKILLLTCFLLMITLITAACSKKENTDTATYSNLTKSNKQSDNGSPVIIPSPSAAERIITDNSVTDVNPEVNNADSTSSLGILPVNTPTKTAPVKKIVAIDAGHQSKGNYGKEPIGPGAKAMKPKVSSGTQGRFTGVPEYKLNLVIAKMVEKELISRGYEVVMIREKNNVDLSNKERADIANESGADIFIRIHADGSNNPDVHGASTLYPSKKNPYVPQLSADSNDLAKAIVDSICDKTGAKNRGAIAHDDMSGINWSTIPVTIIEMGYMTNKTEDKLMQTEDYQDKIVQGICDGIDDYFD